MASDRLSVQGIELEVLRRGAGRPVLLLHGMRTIDPASPFLDRLAARAEVIAPSHPGFGHSRRPDGFRTVYDLVHLYLALLDEIFREKVTVIGFSFGGWSRSSCSWIRSASRSATARRRTSSTSSTRRRKKCDASTGTIPSDGRRTSTRCRTTS
ncbi:MAG: hypothetical protein DMD81_27500 [Candidatus Rokuibacteriota bacterium]|nr:MAG: hypothetical protein DMD81_27500 [Candidatus Rokubacteria bacterium]